MIRGKGMALVILGVLVLAFFYVGQRTYVVQLGYDLEALKGEKKRLEQVHNHLVIEAAALGSLDRVERIAVDSLGMKKPDADQIVLMIPKEGEDLPGSGTKTASLENFQVAQAPVPGARKSSDGETSGLIQKIKNAL